MMFGGNFKRGFSLVEIIVSVSIIALILSVTITSFVELNKREALSSNVIAVMTSLRDARAQTLASVGASQYGVKVDADRTTFFKGSIFSSSTPGNQTFMYSSYIRASSTVQSYVFERVTGNATASGTIDVYVYSNPTIKKAIRVQSTGLVNIDE